MPENSEPTNESESKNESVPKNEMDLLLAWLDPSNRDNAAEKLLGLRRRLMVTFRFYNDRESLADEVIDRVLHRLSVGGVDTTGKAENYMAGVVRNLKLEKIRERSNFQLDDYLVRNENLTPVWSSHNINSDYSDEEHQLLEDCLEKLGDDGKLFLTYFSAGEDEKFKEIRKRLAALQGLSLNDLRVRIHRIKQKISKCVKKNR